VAAQWNPQSASAGILEACRRGELLLCYSPDIEMEIEAVLKRTRAPHGFLSLVEQAFRSGRKFRPRPTRQVIAEDPEDDKYLHCAAAARAQWIITNDRHLLCLGNWKEAVITRPAIFQRSRPTIESRTIGSDRAGHCEAGG
jgi:predicted nucleic acid-binding protein